MRLYLIRHGEATDDSARALTRRGHLDVTSLASQLNAAGLVPSRFLHSGKTRAAQTAAILGECLSGHGPVSPVDGLRPNDPPGPIIAHIAARNEDVALVGHLPSLGRIARALLGDALPPSEMPTASAVVLERDAGGGWSLVACFAPGPGP